MKGLSLLLSALLLLTLSNTFARTWYIKPDGTGDVATIQAGIYATSSGDTVLVAPGTYYENLEMRSWITVRSESGPEATIIDGMASGLVVRCDGVENCQLEGFTMTNGRARHGGGLLCTQSSGVVISGNRIVGNIGLDSGAGIYSYSSSGTFESNLIAYNAVVGIYCSYSSPEIAQNTITHNEGMANLTLYYSSPEIHHNIVANGQRGIVCEPGSNPSLWCNDVWNNTVVDYTCTPGTNDTSVDPLFCDPANLDFNLGIDSPCAGGPICGRIGAYGVGCGPTVREPTTWGAVKSIYR